MNAINRTGIDRFLNSLCAVAILTNGTGSAEMGLNHEGIGGDMGAISATNTDSFIHPNGLVSKASTQKRLPSIRLDGLDRWSRKSERRISQGQASQRVTTNSIEPS